MDGPTRLCIHCAEVDASKGGSQDRTCPGAVVALLAGTRPAQAYRWGLTGSGGMLSKTAGLG